MKKCISFFVAILLCFQFSFTCYSYANDVETVNPKTETIKEEQDKPQSIANYNELYGIEPLEDTPIALSQESRSNHQNIKYLAVFIKFRGNTNQHKIEDEDCVKNAKTIFAV